VSAIAVADAKLPTSYVKARDALEKCVELDECKEWKDKAAALASYAKQADDEELYKSAMKIKGRAVRRMGELLKELNRPEQGGRPPKPKENVGATAPVSQLALAKAAGLSADQAKQAIRVANIPKREFERLIEAEAPPTVTELAKMGTKPVHRTASHLGGRDATEFSDAIKVRGRLRDLADICGSVTPTAAVRGSQDYDHPKMRGWSKTIAAWLERLDAALEKAKET
jgi:hypothetical protein